MANKVKGVTIEFGADTSKLFANLKKIDGTLKDTQNELKQVNRLLKFNPRNTELLKQKQTALADSVKSTQARLKELKSALAKMDTAGIDKASGQYKTMQREIIETESKLKNLQRQQTAYGTATMAQLRATGSAWQTYGAKIAGAGSKLATTVSLWGSIGLFGGKKLVELNEVQLQAETKLTEIYKTRIKAGKQSVENTKRVASALQEQGIYGDELLLQGGQQLATFASTTKTVDTLLPAMANLLAQQKGYSATTGDAVSIANLMGKVLSGQVGALKKVGITFTEAEEKILKYGTEEEKAAVLAQVITNNVGNMNEEFAKTDAGKIQNAKNALSDLGERMGAVILPAFATFAQTFKDTVMPVLERFIGFMEEHPKLAEFAMKAAAIAVALAPVLIIVGKLVGAVGTVISIIGTIMPYLSAIGGAIAVLTGPIGLVIAAIAVLGVAVYNFIAHFDEIKAEAGVLVNNIKTNFMAIVNIVVKVFSVVVNTIKSKMAAAVNMVRNAIARIKSFFNISLRFKDLKMPSISVEWGKADGKLLKALGLPGLPKLKVNWHADAMRNGILFNNPSLFGYDGMIHGAGEAGAEMLIGQNNLMAMIAGAVSNGMASAGNDIASAVATANRLSGNNTGAVNASVYLFKGSPEFGRLIVDTYDTWKGRVG